MILTYESVIRFIGWFLFMRTAVLLSCIIKEEVNMKRNIFYLINYLKDALEISNQEL